VSQESPRRIAALIVGTLSVGWAVGHARDAEAALRLVAYLLGAAGVVVAVSLWRNRQWARHGYWVWATVALVSFVIHDARVEPVFGKVAAAAALVSALLVGLGIVIRSHRSASGS